MKKLLFILFGIVCLSVPLLSSDVSIRVEGYLIPLTMGYHNDVDQNTTREDIVARMLPQLQQSMPNLTSARVLLATPGYGRMNLGETLGELNNRVNAHAAQSQHPVYNAQTDTYSLIAVIVPENQ